MYDIIIVGSGPAGMTAALYALRADKTVLVIEKENFGGQITYSPKFENYPTIPQISGSEFAEKFLEQIISHGAEIEMAEVTRIIDEGSAKKTVVTDNGTFEGKAVIIATGSKHRHLGLENEEKFIGNGISFCAVCDGSFYTDKEVAVIGGGNTALQEAVMLSSLCKKVTVVQNLSFMTGEKRLLNLLEKASNVELVYDCVVSKLIGEDTLDAISLHNTQTNEDSVLKIDGIFVAIGQAPENQGFADVTELNEYGYISADESCLTKTEGIFVAGDCRTKQIRQVTTATADGAVAALAACRYIDSFC